MFDRDKPQEGEPLVRDIMTEEVVTVGPDAGVKELAELFRHHRVGGVPVVNEKAELIGIVTEGDLMTLDADLHFPYYIEFLDSRIYLESTKKFEARLKKATAATVKDVMTADVYTVRPDDPARKAATLMANHGFDRVPVEEDGRVVGIVTRHDIMKLLGL